MNDSTPAGGKTACPQKVIECGARLLQARRKAYEAAQAIMEAYDCIDAAFDALPSSLRRMQLGKMKGLLIEASRCPHLVEMAHDEGRKLLGEVGVAEPTDAQLQAARKGDGGPIILGGGGGGR